jgi:hypothetical protein
VERSRKPDLTHVRDACGKVFASIPLLDAMDKAGKGEIVDALVRHCRSNEHVSLVLRTFQETVFEWKNPIAELVRIAGEIPDKAPDGCDICEDPAWKHDRGRVRWLKYFYLNDAPGLCTCARGDWYRAKDAERKRTEDAR